MKKTVFFLLLILMANPCYSAIKTLDPSKTTIQKAIDDAAAGDILKLQKGDWTGPGNRNISFHGKRLTIRCANYADIATTVIKCSEKSCAFIFEEGETSKSILDGVTIDGAEPNDANTPGAINILGASPTIKNCVIKGSLNGIYVKGDKDDNTTCKPIIQKCTVKSILGTGKHAIWLEDCSAELTDCTISSNTAKKNPGAGIYSLRSILSVIGCDIYGNVCLSKTDNMGAGIFVDNNKVFSIDKGDPNDPNDDVINYSDNQASMYVGGSNFYNNSANTGACIYSKTGDVVLELCQMYGNDNGCVEIVNENQSGSTEIYGSEFWDNTSDKALLYCDTNSTELTVMGCIMSENEGGGIYTDALSVTIADCDIENNYVPDTDGIKIETDGNDVTASISGCTITNNMGFLPAPISFTNGGDITISDCQISQNFSDAGGGIEIGKSNSGGGTAQLNNSIIYRNYGGGGAGINCEVNEVTITDCEITYNFASGIVIKEPTNKGKLVVINSEISGNDGYEGGIYAQINDVNINESFVYNNFGGGITIDANGNEGKLRVSGSYIGSNKGGDGISCDINDIMIIGSNVVSNEAGGINISTNSDEGRLVVSGGSISYNMNGDGIYAEVNDVNILNSYINDNNGGGIYTTTEASGQITVKNCQINNNLNKEGIYAEVENAQISNCQIIKNGGGIILLSSLEDGDVNVTNCRIEHNKATGSGGIYSYAKNFKVSDCVISDHDGGGITLLNSNPNAKAEIWDCLITKNESPDGAAIYLEHDPYEDTNAKIRNCTIVGNKTDDGGSSVWVRSGNSIINSCIIRDNQTNQLIIEGNGIVRYSDIGGGWEGVGNVDQDPFFVMAGHWDSNNVWVEGNYHPLIGSPCINTGDPEFVTDKKDIDLDGDPRIKWGRVDMGSDESINRILPVKADGTDKYATIQAAVNDANDWDFISLSQGTYFGTGNRDIDFLGKDLILESQDSDDPAIVKNTVIDCQGTQIEPHSAFYLTKGEKHPARIEGITIQNGYGHFNLYNFKLYSLGGGIYCKDSAVILRKCDIINNSAEFGGGVFGNNGPIEDCNISNNSAIVEGGGLYLCSNEIRRSSIISNTAHRGGGMSYCSGSISDCVVSENEAIANTFEEGYGGGLYVCDGQIARCQISFNHATLGGGLSICGGMIMNCQISDNNSVGIYGCDGQIINCNIINNNSDMYGGGLFDCGGSIVGCTIADNNAVEIGGGMAACHGKIINSILWANTAPEENQMADCNVPSYSCIQGFTGGIGNISADPLFANMASGNYHLQIGSPCIDKGQPNFDPKDYVDIDGQTRISGTRVDIGADEMVLSPGDFNQDGKVDNADYVIFANSWKAHSGNVNWNPICDLTEDGVVNEEDLAFMAGDWLWGW